MNTDRESAYYAAYEASSLDDALQHEYDNGIGVVLKESIKGIPFFSAVLLSVSKFSQRLQRLLYFLSQSFHSSCKG